MYHIERCAGPCAGLVDHEEYSRLVDELGAFLAGDTAPVVRKLEGQMREAATNLEFELAARVRDRLAAVRKAVEKQQMVTERAEDLDCFGIVRGRAGGGRPGLLREARPCRGAQRVHS